MVCGPFVCPDSPTLPHRVGPSARRVADARDASCVICTGLRPVLDPNLCHNDVAGTPPCDPHTLARVPTQNLMP